jgi:hypothetical protein
VQSALHRGGEIQQLRHYRGFRTISLAPPGARCFPEVQDGQTEPLFSAGNIGDGWLP